MSASSAIQAGAPGVLRAGALALESGAVLPDVEVAYRTWGRLEAHGPRGASNAVLVCHALTGSAELDRWWPDLLGAGRALDPERDFVICSNVLGSCYGTTGPASVDARTGAPWRGDFPAIGVRDMVRLQARLLDHLGIERLALVLGGSLGGMQALEWAASFPDRVAAVAALATTARHSAWAIALSAAQRQAIQADPLWRDGRYTAAAPPVRGLAAARAIAMCGYRSFAGLERRFGRATAEDGAFAVERWLRHHGEALVERFDAATYVTLTHAMDTHDLGRGRGGVAAALRRIAQPALVLSIDSDVLYPPAEQHELAAGLPHATLVTLDSPHGHDGFLIEGRRVEQAVRSFRARIDDAAPRVAIAASAQKAQPPRRAARAERPVAVVLAGATGRVGSQLVRQLAAGNGAVAAETEIALRLAGAGCRRGFAVAAGGLDPARVPAILGAAADGPLGLAAPGRAAHDAPLHDLDVVLDWLDGEAPRPAVFVDCTAAPEVAARYGELLLRGVAVVTASKLAPAGPLAEHRRLLALARRHHAPYLFETTVGAALPFLHTLEGLRLAGDRVRRVEAVLSGSLAFILARLAAGEPFSAAVAEAGALGLTEPHPWDDLSAEDVARKLVILGRAIGLPLERDAVRVEPLVTPPRDGESREDFLARLHEVDAAWGWRAAAASAAHRRLVALARIDEEGARCAVEAVPADSPFARLAPGENLLLVESERCSAVPLAIAGPGAGPEVTAAGVLADVVAAARRLLRASPPAPTHGLVARARPVASRNMAGPPSLRHDGATLGEAGAR